MLSITTGVKPRKDKNLSDLQFWSLWFVNSNGFCPYKIRTSELQVGVGRHNMQKNKREFSRSL